MDPVLFLVPAVVIGAATVLFRLAEHGEHVASCRRVAEECGVTALETPGRLVWQAVTGRWQGREVRLDPHGETKHQRRGTVVTVDALPGTEAEAVTLRPAGHVSFFVGFEARTGPTEIELGDDAFDQAFDVTGYAPFVLAVLDAETRRMLTVLDGQTVFHVAAGQLRMDVEEPSNAPLQSPLARLLPVALEVARRLDPPADAAARLAANARRDPHGTVCVRNLLMLMREFDDVPVTRETVRAVAAGHHSPEARLRAATALGEEGRPVLFEMARADDTEDEWAGSAIATLDAQLPAEEVRGLLEKALRRRRPETAGACLAALGRFGGADAVALLAKVMARETGELALRAAHALGEHRAGGAEDALIGALSAAAPELRVAAAQALGRSGTARAVLPLKEASDAHGERDFRRAARQAIAEIQARATEAEPGQVSLAGSDEAGQLSLAPADEGGRVSLPEPDA
jgi:HEAT repeat protein